MKRRPFFQDFVRIASAAQIGLHGDETDAFASLQKI
jgi:hypothetical protein